MLILRDKILDMAEKFGPADGKYKLIEDVPYKDTEIIFFHTTSDGPFRMEAEIDRIAETCNGEYQIGSTRMFRDHKRNKRLRVTNIDVEK